MRVRAYDPRLQFGPAAALGHHHGAGGEDGVVGQQHDLRVLAAAHEERRDEAADDGEPGKALGTMDLRGRRRANRDQHHECEGRRAADQSVEVERGVHRDVERREPAARDDLAVERVAAAGDAMAAADHDDADQRAEQHAAGLVDPVVVEGVLDEEADAEHQRGRADVEEPAAADPGLERVPLFGRERRLNGHGFGRFAGLRGRGSGRSYCRDGRQRLDGSERRHRRSGRRC